MAPVKARRLCEGMFNEFWNGGSTDWAIFIFDNVFPSLWKAARHRRVEGGALEQTAHAKKEDEPA